MKVWELATGRVVATLPGSEEPVSAVAFAGPATVVGVGNGDQGRPCGGPSARRRPPAGPSRSARRFALAVAPDGSRAAAVWAKPNDKTAGVMVFGRDGADAVGYALDPGRGVECAAVSADATRAVTGGDDGGVRVWNLAAKGAPRVGADWPLFPGGKSRT